MYSIIEEESLPETKIEGRHFLVTSGASSVIKLSSNRPS